MCSTCEVDVAEVVCFCDYPLATLCQGQCLQKHRSSLGFHFEVPISVSPDVAKENFGACQHWLFGLRRAQLALKKNIATIETFEGEIKAACEHIEREIATLKGEYKAAIAKLKQTVAEMIEAAIGETTAQAFHSEPQFTCPLSEWIWWGASPANTSNLRLYSASIQIGDIHKVILVNIEPLSPSLPLFPFTQSGKPTLGISNNLCVSAITEIGLRNRQFPGLLESQLRVKELKLSKGVEIEILQKAEIKDEKADFVTAPMIEAKDQRDGVAAENRVSEKLEKIPMEEEKAKNREIRPEYLPVNIPQVASYQEKRQNSGLFPSQSQCRVCQLRFIPEDEAYFCPAACRCRHCVIEAVVEVPAANVCKYCQRPFQSNVLQLANMGRKRCHVCGIVVKQEEVATTSCTICIKCVIISEEKTFLGLWTHKGKCQYHSATLFPVNMQYYRAVREKDAYSACCSFNLIEGKQLNCGHYVCRTHSEHLKFCRTCKKAVQRQ